MSAEKKIIKKLESEQGFMQSLRDCRCEDDLRGLLDVVSIYARSCLKLNKRNSKYLLEYYYVIDEDSALLEVVKKMYYKVKG